MFLHTTIKKKVQCDHIIGEYRDTSMSGLYEFYACAKCGDDIAVLLADKVKSYFAGRPAQIDYHQPRTK